MQDAPPQLLQGVPNQCPSRGGWAQNGKKILNRRNEPKDMLKTRGLAFSEAKNELFFRSKKRHSKRRISPTIDELLGGRAGFRCQVPGDGGSTRVRESGVRSQNEEHLHSEFCLMPTAYCIRGVGRALAPLRSLRQDVVAGWERRDS
jgi:hypothetical protein